MHFIYIVADFRKGSVNIGTSVEPVRMVSVSFPGPFFSAVPKLKAKVNKEKGQVGRFSVFVDEVTPGKFVAAVRRTDQEEGWRTNPTLTWVAETDRDFRKGSVNIGTSVEPVRMVSVSFPGPFFSAVPKLKAKVNKEKGQVGRFSVFVDEVTPGKFVAAVRRTDQEEGWRTNPTLTWVAETDRVSDVCTETEFRCADLTCIPGEWRCDGEPDCPDSTDESPEECRCPFGYGRFEDSCFKVSRLPADFAGAEEECLNDGARLAAIKDQATHEYILSQVAPVANLYVLWIGLEDRENEGSFVFSDGTTLSDDSWQNFYYPGASAQEDEDCVEMYFGSERDAAYWNDQYCTLPRRFICQIAASPSPDVEMTMPPVPEVPDEEEDDFPAAASIQDPLSPEVAGLLSEILPGGMFSGRSEDVQQTTMAPMNNGEKAEEAEMEETTDEVEIEAEEEATEEVEIEKDEETTEEVDMEKQEETTDEETTAETDAEKEEETTEADMDKEETTETDTEEEETTEQVKTAEDNDEETTEVDMEKEEAATEEPDMEVEDVETIEVDTEKEEEPIAQVDPEDDTTEVADMEEEATTELAPVDDPQTDDILAEVTEQPGEEGLPEIEEDSVPEEEEETTEIVPVVDVSVDVAESETEQETEEPTMLPGEPRETAAELEPQEIVSEVETEEGEPDEQTRQEASEDETNVIGVAELRRLSTEVDPTEDADAEKGEPIVVFESKPVEPASVEEIVPESEEQEDLGCAPFVAEEFSTCYARYQHQAYKIRRSGKLSHRAFCLAHYELYGCYTTALAECIEHAYTRFRTVLEAEGIKNSSAALNPRAKWLRAKL
uniref:C-type lectin domain-containing protein n=1 Tax=Branchiostoma floridae TaxID=7739 RepID=C3XSG4_BRAFL|eukprot:XP_002612876.1 hypothetical protein BRAFLDRAFT_129979 [Branchiostoma floridae]